MIIFSSDFKPYFQIIQLGCGANGSAVIQQITQLMNIFGIKGSYMIADPDTVEEHNLKNQLFLPKDIDQKKATVLARRYGNHYNVPVFSYTQSYVDSEQILSNLFNDDYINFGFSQLKIPILIGCVDNNFSRQLMHRYFLSQEDLIYIDVGVEGSRVPQDERTMSQWTTEEMTDFLATGWTGQVVCGLRWKGETILDPVCTEFPDMLEDEDPIGPSEMACSQLISKEPQKLLTNKYAALEVVSYFNSLFSELSLPIHKSYVTLKHKCKVKVYPVEFSRLLGTE